MVSDVEPPEGELKAVFVRGSPPTWKTFTSASKT